MSAPLDTDSATSGQKNFFFFSVFRAQNLTYANSDCHICYRQKNPEFLEKPETVLIN